MAWYKHPIFVCIVACIIPLLGGFGGSLLTDTSKDSWYGRLEKPVFNPPNWVNFHEFSFKRSNFTIVHFQVFFPAWTILYIAMGFASFRVWYKGGGFTGKAKIPLIFYVIQLIINWIWTPVFFGAQALGWAFVVIVTMWVFIVATTWLFFRVDLIAGFCMLPYIAWVTFASVLNFSLWYLN